MTTPLDEKGLEAANVAYERYGQTGDLMAQRLSPGCMEAIIRAYLASSPIQADGLGDRLRPSAVVDETPGLAVTMLRRLDMPALADRLNAWIVENNDLKSKAQAALAVMQGERDEALRVARELTKALVNLTPGGSEYFSRSPLLDDYFADVDACTRVVRERFESGHQAKIERVDERRRAEAAESEVKRLTEEKEAACNDLRSFMTSFVREHFPENTEWKPLPDLLGMLTQMDNASTIARTYKARIKALEEVVKL